MIYSGFLQCIRLQDKSQKRTISSVPRAKARNTEAVGDLRRA